MHNPSQIDNSGTSSPQKEGGGLTSRSQSSTASSHHFYALLVLIFQSEEKLFTTVIRPLYWTDASFLKLPFMLVQLPLQCSFTLII